MSQKSCVNCGNSMMEGMQRCPKCGFSQQHGQSRPIEQPHRDPLPAGGRSGENSASNLQQSYVHGQQPQSWAAPSTNNTSVSINTEGKNMVVAYLLWWFLGLFGIHRFYLGRIGTGITQLVLLIGGFVLSVIFVGYFLLIALFIWWLLDAYFVYAIVNESNGGRGAPILNFQTATTSSSTNDLDRLSKLHDLYQRGAISQQEYDRAKADLMRRP